MYVISRLATTAFFLALFVGGFHISVKTGNQNNNAKPETMLHKCTAQKIDTACALLLNSTEKLVYDRQRNTVCWKSSESSDQQCTTPPIIHLAMIDSMPGIHAEEFQSWLSAIAWPTP